MESRFILNYFRFRWLALQLNELTKCLTQGSVKHQLKSLPGGLDETYDRILLGIDKQYHNHTKILLQWLAFAVRPMALEELAETLTVDLHGENGPQYQSFNKLWNIHDIFKTCPGLVIQSNGASQTVL